MTVLRGILADGDPVGVVFACLSLVIVVGALAKVVLMLRKWYLSPDDDALPSTGFTLADLRELHRSGKISEEEFNRAKEKIVTAHQRALQRDAEAAKPDVNKSPPQGP